MNNTQQYENHFGYIRKNLDEVTASVEAARKIGGQDKVTLVCVTKSATDDELKALVSLGIPDIGENRPQELSRRGKLLAEAGYHPNLHEIGRLQTNKVKMIAADVCLIQSLDRIELAEEIEKCAAKCGRRIPVLVEVNSGREEQKGGVMPEDVLTFCEKIVALGHLELRGLMTMGPVLTDAEAYRPYFRLTKELLEKTAERFRIPDPILSMGMSDSFLVAVEEGATVIRVGRRLFRKAPNDV